MSARRKKGSPMKYRGFYCGDELWTEMQKCAEKLDVSDSDYIRKAIAEQIQKDNALSAGTHHSVEPYSAVLKAAADGITGWYNPEEDVAKKKPKQPMVQTFSKEGKK